MIAKSVEKPIHDFMIMMGSLLFYPSTLLKPDRPSSIRDEIYFGLPEVAINC